MGDIFKDVQEYGPYIMNTSTMLISIFASFLSATLKKKTQIGGLIALALFYNVLTWYVYENKHILNWTILLTAVCIFVHIILIWNKEIVSRKKIDRMIRKYTDNADQYKPICIFGGDLDFFGSVAVNPKSIDKLLHRNEIIEFNKQYNQIKNKGFETHILSIKPDGDSGHDEKTRIRIGFLGDHLKGKLKIKYFEEKECSTCPERTSCLACDVCQTCPEGKKCKRMGLQLCDKLNKDLQSRCYNPDTQLRGRIATRKSDGSISAAIVTTYQSGKTYILKEYSSNTKECTIYQNIWNVWWKKCKTDDAFMEKCIADYKKFVEDAERSTLHAADRHM